MKIGTPVLYVLARLVVWLKVRAPEGLDPQAGPDRLPARFIPSVAGGNREDRVLAEIDQNGSIFATDPVDAVFFGGPPGPPAPRKKHRVQIVLVGGDVRVRKWAIRRPVTTWAWRIREWIKWEMYLEAAALLRLDGCVSVPKLRNLDPATGALEMDYVWGRDLRRILAKEAAEPDEDEVARTFEAMVRGADPVLSVQLRDLARRVIEHGVVPRDLHAGNLIRGDRSGALHLVDFNFAFLRPVPGWRTHAAALASLVGDAVPAWSRLPLPSGRSARAAV